MMFSVISHWEGVEVLEAKYCDIIGMSKLLGLRWDLFLLSDVPSPVMMSLCQFPIDSSLKGNRLLHQSPVIAGSLLIWPCHSSWCTLPAKKLETDKQQLHQLELPFLLQDSSHEVSLLVRADHLPVAVLSNWSGLPENFFQCLWPFPLRLFTIWICLSMKPPERWS